LAAAAFQAALVNSRKGLPESRLQPNWPPYKTRP
jgi:hypothetical protein